MQKLNYSSIHKDAIFIWRIHGLVWLITFVSVSVLLLYYTYWGDIELPGVTSEILVVLLISIGLLLSTLIPSIRWKRWKYIVTEDFITLRRGIFIITETTVPIKRVQHISVKEGPLLRMKKLATLSIHTAATTHVLPALTKELADTLRERIAIIAKVEENDL